MATIQYRIQTTRTVSVRGGVGVNNPDEPWSPSEQQSAQEARWELIDDLMGGTDTMRLRGERWLPREPGETPNAYRSRLARSFLSNGFRDTIEKLVAKPFSRSVNVAPDSLGDERLDEIIDDADRGGNDVTTIARRLFTDMVQYGKCHLLVDYPTTDQSLSLAQERSEKVRPVFLRVSPRDIVGWRYERRGDGGAEVLTQVRIRECRLEDVGKYGSRVVHYVRVINAPPLGGATPQEAIVAAAGAAATSQATWELFKRGDGEQWTKDSNGTHTFPGIPLATAYAERDEFMTATPPMQDLAELQLCHWQSYSDQRNILKYVRMAMLAKTGISQEEMEKPSTIAPNEVLKSVNPDAKYYFVEHSGAGIQAGRDDLKDIEERMEVLGMQPLAVRTADSTATGKAMDENKNETTIQAWIRSLENMLTEAFKMAATWIGKELPADFSVDVFNDFGVGNDRAAEGDLLLRARAQGDITRLTMLREMQRRGIISASVDVEAEDDELGAEAPIIPGGPFGQDPNNPFAKKGEEDGDGGGDEPGGDGEQGDAGGGDGKPGGNPFGGKPG